MVLESKASWKLTPGTWENLFATHLALYVDVFPFPYLLISNKNLTFTTFLSGSSFLSSYIPTSVSNLDSNFMASNHSCEHYLLLASRNEEGGSINSVEEMEK